MKHQPKSIRTFIGAKDFQISSAFYRDFGCDESIISPKMSYFSIGNVGFYLQDYYVKTWINNSMVFLEVDNAMDYWNFLVSSEFHLKYKTVKITPMKEYDWGRECFLHDPSGVLWHFGEFYD